MSIKLIQHLYKATGYHFNQRGLKIHNMKVTIIEKIRSMDPRFRKAIEKSTKTEITFVNCNSLFFFSEML